MRQLALKSLSALLCLAVSVSTMFLTTPAFSQESDAELLKEIRDTLNDIGALANNTIEQAITMVANMAYPSTPTVADTMLVNLKYKQEAVPMQAYEANNRLKETISLYLNPVDLSSVTATRAWELMPGTENQVSVKVPNFLIGSILNRSGFAANSNEAVYAQNFMNVMMDLDNTPKNIKFIAFKALTNPQANYLTALGSFIAAQSVPLGNLYNMMSKRIIIPGLGTNVGMIRLYPLDENDTGQIGATIADASPLQVDEYLANRRVMNPKWYADMEAAAPSTVARETLYVLAEIRQEMFKQRAEIEKLTANVASLQLQAAQEGNREKFLIKPPGS